MIITFKVHGASFTTKESDEFAIKKGFWNAPSMQEFFKDKPGVLANAISVMARETPVCHTNNPFHKKNKDGVLLYEKIKREDNGEADDGKRENDLAKPIMIDSWSKTPVNHCMPGDAYFATINAIGQDSFSSSSDRHCELLTGRASRLGTRNPTMNSNKTPSVQTIEIARILNIHPETSARALMQKNKQAIQVGIGVRAERGQKEWSSGSWGTSAQHYENSSCPISKEHVTGAKYNQSSAGVMCLVTYDGEITMDLDFDIVEKIKAGPGFGSIGIDGVLELIA